MLHIKLQAVPLAKIISVDDQSLIIFFYKVLVCIAHEDDYSAILAWIFQMYKETCMSMA